MTIKKSYKLPVSWGARTLCAVLAACAITSCTDDNDISNNGKRSDDPTGQIVQFCVGNEGMTRAGIPFMENGGRFAVKMYYRDKNNATNNTPFTIGNQGSGDVSESAWMEVIGNEGKAVYRNKEYTTPWENIATADRIVFNGISYGELDADAFYWKNRLKHAFLAKADYNKLKTDKYSEGLRLDKNNYYITIDDVKHTQDIYKIIDNSYTEMLNQPDPILACTVKAPAYSSIEANRVDLLFKHQFSQIQVSLKASNDGTTDEIKAEDIIYVKILGTAEYGFVTNQITKTGSIEPIYDSGNLVYPAFAWDQYFPAATMKVIEEGEEKWINPTTGMNPTTNKPYGTTSMNLFDVKATGSHSTTPVEAGYLKTFEGIAFGRLRALEIKWIEHANKYGETEKKNDIEHVITYPITEGTNDYLQLKSGTRYIYKLELRRGQLIVLKAEILPWNLLTTPYGGTAKAQET